jgi:RNA recognition motif-containing protein
MFIFVANLSRQVTDDQLRQTFEPYGAVSSASVVLDKVTNKSRRFGFVDMPNSEEALAAIEAMNGQELDGMVLDVNQARSRGKPSNDGYNRSNGGYHRYGGGFNRSDGGANRSGGKTPYRRSW